MSKILLAPGQSQWLLFLLLAWAVLLFGGFSLGRLSLDRQRRMPAWTRMGSSGVLALAAWSRFTFARDDASPLPLLVATGMTLGLAGDLLMAGWLPARKRELAGIVAFGFGHIAYITGIWLYAHRHALAAPVTFFGAWLAWLLFALAAWYFVVFRGGRRTVLHLAALPYTLLLASTTGLASGLALQAPAFLPLALGAVLFLASDLLLAARLFNGLRFYLSDDWVWLTYGPGQMLIVYAIAWSR